MGKIIRENIDSKKKKLSEVKGEVLKIDPYKDYTQVSDEEFKSIGKELATNEAKLKALYEEIKGLYEMNHRELVRHRESAQLPLFDIDSEEYYDNDGTVIKLGTISESKTVYDTAAIKAEAGYDVKVTSSMPEIFSKPSARVLKRKVDKAIEEGKLSQACKKVQTISQVHINFDFDSSKGNN